MDFSYFFKGYLSLRSMFSFFQVTDKKKLAENARTSHPRAIGSSFFTTNTAFLLKKKRNCCFEVVNVFLFRFSERNYAARNNVGFADDSEFASLTQMFNTDACLVTSNLSLASLQHFKRWSARQRTFRKADIRRIHTRGHKRVTLVARGFSCAVSDFGQVLKSDLCLRPSAKHVSACGRRNETPRRTREKTSDTQGIKGSALFYIFTPTYCKNINYSRRFYV